MLEVFTTSKLYLKAFGSVTVIFVEQL